MSVAEVFGDSRRKTKKGSHMTKPAW